MVNYFNIQRSVPISHYALRTTHYETMNKIKKGQKFKSLNFLKVKGLIKFKGNYIKIFHGILPKGKIIISERNASSKDEHIEFHPESYRFFEKMYLSVNDRENPEYKNYVIILSFDKLTALFESAGYTKYDKRR